MTGRKESLDVENTQPTEEEVLNFYRELVNFIKEKTVLVVPGSDYAKRAHEAQGFLFSHSGHTDIAHQQHTNDHYQSTNIATEIENPDGGTSHSGLTISTEKYLCPHDEAHPPSEIPEKTPIQLSLEGSGECFVINGTSDGSGLGQLRNPTKLESPLTMEPFRKYKTYFDRAFFQAPQPFLIEPL